MINRIQPDENILVMYYNQKFITQVFTYYICFIMYINPHEYIFCFISMHLWALGMLYVYIIYMNENQLPHNEKASFENDLADVADIFCVVFVIARTRFV